MAGYFFHRPIFLNNSIRADSESSNKGLTKILDVEIALMDFVKHLKDKTLFVAVRLRQFSYYLAILFIKSSFNLMVIGFLWWYFLLAGSRVPCSSLFVRLAESSPLHGFH